MSLQRAQPSGLRWMSRCFRPEAKHVGDPRPSHRMTTQSAFSTCEDRPLTFREVEAVFKDDLGVDPADGPDAGPDYHASFTDSITFAELGRTASRDKFAPHMSEETDSDTEDDDICAPRSQKYVHFNATKRATPFADKPAPTPACHQRNPSSSGSPLGPRISTGSGWSYGGPLVEPTPSLPSPPTSPRHQPSADVTNSRPSADSMHSRSTATEGPPARSRLRRAARSLHAALSMSRGSAPAATTSGAAAAKHTAQHSATGEVRLLRPQSDSASETSGRIPSSQGELLSAVDGRHSDPQHASGHLVDLEPSLRDPRPVARRVRTKEERAGGREDDPSRAWHSTLRVLLCRDRAA
eukprot:jgi/Ulvmu1/8704/UM047_0044.1